jgi:hypothetical protein
MYENRRQAMVEKETQMLQEKTNVNDVGRCKAYQEVK